MTPLSTGTKVLAGGKREGAVMEATLLEDVPADADVMCSEVFGPVLLMERYAVFKDAVNKCASYPCVSGISEIPLTSLVHHASW